MRKGGKGGERPGDIAAIQQVDGGIGEKVSRAGHMRHVKAIGFYALNERAVGFGGLKENEFFQRFPHEVSKIGLELVSQGRSASQYGHRQRQ